MIRVDIAWPDMQRLMYLSARAEVRGVQVDYVIKDGVVRFFASRDGVQKEAASIAGLARVLDAFAVPA